MEGAVPRILKTFFIGSTAFSHTLWMVPGLNDKLRTYGARVKPATTTTGDGKHPADKAEPQPGLLGSVVKFLAELKVPHSWFTGFYIWSSLCSAFWGYQLYTRGSALQYIAKHTDYAGKPSMSFNQILLVWGLFQFQGLRRLYESYIFSKPSEAKMNFLIFAVGIAYYGAMSVSMWIEGLPALMSTSKPLGDAAFGAPSLKSFLFIPMFLLASGIQHDCHRYLFSLKKYTFPTHPAWGKVLAPHYLAEICIYTSLSLLGAPKGQLVNRSLLIGTLFVLFNLGEEADGTKEWYERKFGEDKVRGKDRVIPYLW